MSCARVLEVVDAQHLSTCVDCQAARAVPQGASLESLKTRALAELKENPNTVPWFAGAIGFTAVTVIVAGLSMQLMSANTVQHASANLQQVSAAAWAMTMLAGCFLAVLPAARLARQGLFAGLGLCFVLTLVAASGVGPPGVGSIGCALTEWALALIPLGVGLAVITGFAFDVTRALAAMGP